MCVECISHWPWLNYSYKTRPLKLRPKGWSPESITTYLSNEEFLQLAKQGYVGTRGATTEHLQQVILESFHAGRGVIFTVDQTEPGQARRLRHG